VREPFAELIRSTISANDIAETLKAGMQATETKFFAEKGIVQEQREVIAWGERRLYAELVAEYGEYHVPEKSDQKHVAQEGKSLGQQETRACTGCGREFEVRRFWQLQCSARCRQRAYVQRQVEALNYYGA